MRFVFYFIVVVLLAMQYWSSLLVEEDLKQVKQEIVELRARPAVLATAVQQKAVMERSHMDAKLPNLLSEDPFYHGTLQKLLPQAFTPSGTLQYVTVGVPSNLHPFNNYADVRSYIARCSLSVSRNHFGIYETYAPYAAVKMEERDHPDEEYLEYWIFLREGMFWQPLSQKWFGNEIHLSSWFLQKHPVTAHDFKLMYDAVMNPAVTEGSALTMRQFYQDITEVRAVDDLTLVVRWKKHQLPDGSKRVKYLAKGLTASFAPLPLFLYGYYPDGTKIIRGEAFYATDSSWGQIFQQHWAKNVIPSCGPYVFQGLSDEGVRFIRNPDHFEPLDALMESIQVTFKMTEDNMWQSFKANEVQSYTLPAIQIADWQQFKQSPAYKEQEKAGAAIKTLEYPYNAYAYVGWNLTKPLFSSAKIRQAMTFAINRPRIIKDILDGKASGLAAPFSSFSNANDPSLSPYPYDPGKAKKLLEEEGFADFDGDGIIEKKVGEGYLKFSFYLTYYVKNLVAKAVCDQIAASLKTIGVQCKLKGVDLADLSRVFDEKDFDAYFLSWVLPGPPEDLSQLWHSSLAKEKGSSNSVGFANPEVDQIIEDLTYEYNPEKRQELYHRFARIFYREQPYTLLYTPINTLLYREVLQNVFSPAQRQDLIPGANISEPDSSIYWLRS